MWDVLMKYEKFQNFRLIAVIESSKKYVFIIDCFCQSKKLGIRFYFSRVVTMSAANFFEGATAHRASTHREYLNPSLQNWSLLR